MSALTSAHSIPHPRANIDGGYSAAIDSLRTFLTVLVVSQHAAIAYTSFAPFELAPLLTATPLNWPTYPVVDRQRSGLADVAIAFSESFFMSMMFLVSGLFVWRSLESKGRRRFLIDRLRRLGPAFALMVAVLSPAAYAASYLQTTAPGHSVGEFWRQWMALDFWPAGPAWFLWVLLAFNAVAALAFPYARRTIGSVNLAARQPGLLFVLGLLASFALYLPASLVVEPTVWRAIGPFSVQLVRVPLYFWMFSVGVALGAARAEQTLFSPVGTLARRWWQWALLSLTAYMTFLLTLPVVLPKMEYSRRWSLVAGVLFLFACNAHIWALLAVFLRYASTRRRWVDWLTYRAFGIYVVHHVITTWTQYALVPTSIPAAAKYLLCLTTGVLASALIVGAFYRLLEWCRAMAPRSAGAVAPAGGRLTADD